MLRGNRQTLKYNKTIAWRKAIKRRTLCLHNVFVAYSVGKIFKGIEIVFD